MTILTSVAARGLARSSGALCDMLQYGKYLVWFWTPYKHAGQSVPCPGQRCNLTARRQDPSIPTLRRPVPPGQLLLLRRMIWFLPGTSLKFDPGPHSIPTRCLRHVRDSDGTRLVRSCTAVPIYIGHPPPRFSIRDPTFLAHRTGTWSRVPSFFGIRLDFHFRIYERQSPGSSALLIPNEPENGCCLRQSVLLSRACADPLSVGSRFSSVRVSFFFSL